MNHTMTGSRRPWLSFLAALALSASAAYSQNLPFQATYGDSLTEIGSGLISSAAGGYIAVGTVITPDPNPIQPSDIYVVKLSGCGEIEWKKRYDIGRQDRGVKIRQTGDGGYLVMGNVEVATPCQNQLDIFLMKINSTGDVQWARTYGGSDFDQGTDLQMATPYGDLSVIVGNTRSFGNGGLDGIILFIDQMGYVMWGKTLGGTNNDHFTSCAVSPNGEITVTGLTISGPTPGAARLLLTVFGPFGSVAAPFPLAYGNSMDPMAGLSVIRLASGQILVAGNRNVGGAVSAYLLHTQSNGAYINDRAFSGGPAAYTEFQQLRQEPVQGTSFAMTGVAANVTGGFGSGDVYFVETDLMLNPVVQMLHGGAGDDVGVSITRSSTGPGHIIAGTTNSFGFGDNDMYVIQQNTLGSSGCHDAVPVIQTSTPRIGGTAVAMQLSGVSVGCAQEVQATVYGDRYPLCDQCPPANSAAPADPEISSLATTVRASDMTGR